MSIIQIVDKWGDVLEVDIDTDQGVVDIVCHKYNTFDGDKKTMVCLSPKASKALRKALKTAEQRL